MAPNEKPRVRLGELLVQTRVLTQEKLNEALALQQSESAAGRPKRLGRLLVEKGYVDETQLTQLLGRQLAVPWVSLYHVDFSRQLLNLVPREVAEAYTIVPVYVRHVRGQGDTLYVATDDPTNQEGLDRVAAYASLPVRPMIASATDIRAAIRVYYGGGSPSQQNPAATPVKAPPPPPSSDPAQPSTQPAVPNKMDEVIPSTVADAPRAKEVQVRVVEPMPQIASDVPTVVSASPPAPAIVSQSDPVGASAAKTSKPSYDDAPEIEAKSIPIPAKKPRKAIALTFLDGTTISLPAPRNIRGKRAREEAPPSEPLAAVGEDELTARDLVSALRAVSHGVDASEILGENPRWEKMFAALLSLLLKKHLIADWEFVEEYGKI